MVSMDSNLNKVIYFVDLDDTIFQTKRKLLDGIYQATNVENPQKVSFFSEQQKALLDYIFSSDETLFIPITARTKHQYARTVFSTDSRVVFHSIYYGGLLHYKGELMTEYQARIRPQLIKSIRGIERVLEQVNLDFGLILKRVNVDDHYYVLHDLSESELKIVTRMKEESKLEVDMYISEKSVTLLPKVINKTNVVNYLCDILKPKLVIGMGDSFADLDFLNRCDFKIISHIGDLNRRLNAKD
jgi:hypothetical protein